MTIREDMSIEAQVAAMHWNGHTMSRNMTLSFKRPWVISPRMKKGLEELVETGYLTKHRLNSYRNCPVEYRPTDKMEDFGPRLSMAELKEHSFSITEERPEPKEDVV